MGIILLISVIIAIFVRVYYVIKEHNEDKEDNANIRISEVKNSNIDIGTKKTTVYVKNVNNSNIKIRTR